MQDSANSDDESDDVCVPYIKDDENNKSIAPNDIIPGTDTKEGEYTIRYMVVSGSGIESDIYEYDAKVDVTAPTLVVTAKSNVSNVLPSLSLIGNWLVMFIKFVLLSKSSNEISPVSSLLVCPRKP